MTNTKLYSLVEYRNKTYEDLEVRASDSVILMCAIIIASVGLNMNSIPVIIGAMLISPLMTPILGIGFSLAALDYKLLKKSVKLLATQAAISLTASTIYFLISPIKTASPEIIARTSPTIWDVIIAFAGGTAGIIGARKKEANNIVPGVAIATALMPPLCTVGYSIANGNTRFLFGSLYLFLINCSFIVIATVIGVRAMMIGKNTAYSKSEHKMKKLLITIALIVIIPSIFSAGKLVQETIQKEAVNKFIDGEFKDQVIINKNYNKNTNVLTITIAGTNYTSKQIDEIYKKQKYYGIENIKLEIKQVPSLNKLDEETLTKYINQIVENKMNGNTGSKYTNNEKEDLITIKPYN